MCGKRKAFFCLPLQFLKTVQGTACALILAHKSIASALVARPIRAA
jgi:hypothetical protein